jgi:hypothetical protein
LRDFRDVVEMLLSEFERYLNGWDFSEILFPLCSEFGGTSGSTHPYSFTIE